MSEVNSDNIAEALQAADLAREEARHAAIDRLAAIEIERKHLKALLGRKPRTVKAAGKTRKARISGIEKEEQA
jgi:predicted secreted Zn-dependent protease